MIPITVSNTAAIRIFTQEDQIALEYEDRVLLRFTPDISSLEGDVEGVGEYIRSTATINIIDDDRKLFDITYYVVHVDYVLIETGLEIYFEELDYRVWEDSSFPIVLQHAMTQNPFLITLFTATINEAESMGLEVFINPGNISPSERATAGKVCVLCIALVPVDKTSEYTH